MIRSRRAVRSPIVATASVVVIGLTAACGSSDSPAPTTNPTCTVTSVTVTPGAATIVNGSTQQLAAAVAPAATCASAAVTWQTSNAGIATISTTGLVTAVATGGPVTITALAQQQSGVATINVIPVPVATVTVTPGTATMFVGQTSQLAAATKDGAGNVLAGRAVAWTTSDVAIATVSASGLVTAVGPGAATITATSETKTGTAAVTIQVANPPNRFAYALADSAAPASGTYPPNVNTAFNLTGGTMSVTHNSSGDYTVRLGRLAKQDASYREVVLVTAQETTPVRCSSTGWTNAPNAVDLLVSVVCYNSLGLKVDTRFTVLLVGAGALPARSAFATITDATATPQTPSASLSYTSAAGAIGATRTGTGAYSLGVGLPHAAGAAEAYLISPYAAATNFCEIASWAAELQVQCYNASLTPANTTFSALLVERGRAGKRWGFASPEQINPQAPYNPDPAYAASSSGGAITVTRTGAGSYTVTFAGLARPAGGTDIVAVSPYLAPGSSGVECHTEGWANGPGASDLSVRVKCYTGTGAFADSRFTVLVIE